MKFTFVLVLISALLMAQQANCFFGPRFGLGFGFRRFGFGFGGLGFGGLGFGGLPVPVPVPVPVPAPVPAPVPVPPPMASPYGGFPGHMGAPGFPFGKRSAEQNSSLIKMLNSTFVNTINLNSTLA